MRAFFADGVDELHVPRVVEGLPALLHLSLFLFFCGLVIFLFNINHAIYSVVMLWIAIFTTVYVWITLMPILRHDSPYYTPLSTSAWFLYSNTLYVIFKILVFVSPRYYFSFHLRSLFRKLRDRYRGWISGGVEKAAEEATSKRSSEIDIRILDWTLGALREDDTLEKFFAAIPGLFKSKLVKDLETHFTFALYARFWEALDGFLERTLSSNSVQDSIKTHRLVISTNIMQLIPSPLPGENFPSGTLSNTFNRIPPSIRMGQVLARWCDNHDERISERARIGIVGILMSVEERDDRWVALAESQLRLSKRALENYVAHGDDSISLAILTHVTRQAIRSNPRIWLDQLSFLTRFNILNTHPELQNDFCASWNQTVLEARKRGYNSNPVEMLYEIHHHYIALHQGTDADLTAFTASTDDFHILWEPSSYPLCNIPSHRAHSFAPSRTHVPRALSALSPTSVGHYFDVPPHLTVTEPQPTLAIGSTTGVRHAEEPDIIPGLRSTDELSSSPRSTSLHPTTQVTSTGPSVPESIEAISQDPNDAPFNRPTAHVHTGETVESSHVPTDIPLPFPQPNLVLTPVIPSAGPYIPSFPVPDTRGAPDLLQYFSFVPNTASSSGRQHQQEVAPPWVARDVSGIPFMGGSLPRSISSGEATLGTNNESTVVPPVVSGSPPSLIPLALHDGVIPIEPSSSSGAGSDLIQADHPFHTQGPQFSSPITVPRLSHTPPHVTFVQDTHVPMRVGTVTGNDDTDDASIEMEVFSLQLGTQRVPLGARNVSSISPLEDRKYSPENL